jgi:hypothetical protein
VLHAALWFARRIHPVVFSRRLCAAWRRRRGLSRLKLRRIFFRQLSGLLARHFHGELAQRWHHPDFLGQDIREVRAESGRQCNSEKAYRMPAGGTRNAFGGCTPTPKIASCSSGVWNGYSCGAEGWFNDCRQLADQVSLQQRQLNRNGIRDGLRFRLLEDQYDYCQRAFRGTLFGFGLEE